MKLLKKCLAVLLAMVLTLGAFSCLKAEAKEKITIKTPKIKSVKLSKDGTSIIVTINKTNKDVEGYKVYISGEGVYDNSLYQNETEVFSNEKKFDLKDKLVATTEQPGTKKQTVTIKTEKFSKYKSVYKSIPSGKYTIKVRSYNKKKNGKTRYSEYSKEKTLKVSITETTGEGYKTKYDFSTVSKGDTITFGAYEQDANIKNGQEPIEWVVLSKTKSQLFVVSKYALDAVPYNLEEKDVTWETCTLRKWLNDKFYNAAFNKEEKALIKTTTVENFDNPKYNTPAGNDTKDKVFLLSMLDMIESDYGFSKSYGTFDQNRRCAPTAYAIARNILYTSSYKTKDGEAACRWRLRSPGDHAIDAVCVDCDGDVSALGYDVYYANGVRPAIEIILDKTQKNDEENEDIIMDKSQIIDEKKEDEKITIKQGDIIKFGTYEQDNNVSNGKEPIEWIVLSNNDSEMFVLSKYGLDCKPFNPADTWEEWDALRDMTWEKCSLRNWLNNDFYNTAFSTSEKSMIKNSYVKNVDNNGSYHKNAGNDTTDHIFLLSYDEVMDVKYGFVNDEYDDSDLRRCIATEYAKANGAWTSKKILDYPEIYVDEEYEEATLDGKPTSNWWLRTAWGAGDTYCIDYYGFIGTRCFAAGFQGWYEAPTFGNGLCVRPAMIIKLGS